MCHAMAPQNRITPMFCWSCKGPLCHAYDGNKHDLPNAMNAAEITNKFDLHSLQQICCSVCSKFSSCCHWQNTTVCELIQIIQACLFQVHSGHMFVLEFPLNIRAYALKKRKFNIVIVFFFMSLSLQNSKIIRAIVAF